MFLTLKKELEITKIEEIKNIPLVRVLDEATPPLRKSWPNRRAIVFVVSVFTIILAVVAAFIAEFLASIYSQEKVKITLNNILDDLKNDLKNIGSLFRKTNS